MMRNHKYDIYNLIIIQNKYYKTTVCSIRTKNVNIMQFLYNKILCKNSLEYDHKYSTYNVSYKINDTRQLYTVFETES